MNQALKGKRVVLTGWGARAHMSENYKGALNDLPPSTVIPFFSCASPLQNANIAPHPPLDSCTRESRQMSRQGGRYIIATSPHSFLSLVFTSTDIQSISLLSIPALSSKILSIKIDEHKVNSLGSFLIQTVLGNFSRTWEAAASSGHRRECSEPLEQLLEN